MAKNPLNYQCSGLAVSCIVIKDILACECTEKLKPFFKTPMERCNSSMLKLIKSARLLLNNGDLGDTDSIADKDSRNALEIADNPEIPKVEAVIDYDDDASPVFEPGVFIYGGAPQHQKTFETTNALQETVESDPIAELLSSSLMEVSKVKAMVDPANDSNYVKNIAKSPDVGTIILLSDDTSQHSAIRRLAIELIFSPDVEPHKHFIAKAIVHKPPVKSPDVKIPRKFCKTFDFPNYDLIPPQSIIIDGGNSEQTKVRARNPDQQNFKKASFVDSQLEAVVESSNNSNYELNQNVQDNVDKAVVKQSPAAATTPLPVVTNPPDAVTSPPNVVTTPSSDANPSFIKTAPKLSTIRRLVFDYIKSPPKHFTDKVTVTETLVKSPDGKISRKFSKRVSFDLKKNELFSPQPISDDTISPPANGTEFTREPDQQDLKMVENGLHQQVKVSGNGASQPSVETPSQAPQTEDDSLDDTYEDGFNRMLVCGGRKHMDKNLQISETIKPPTVHDDSLNCSSISNSSRSIFEQHTKMKPVVLGEDTVLVVENENADKTIETNDKSELNEDDITFCEGIDEPDDVGDAEKYQSSSEIDPIIKKAEQEVTVVATEQIQIEPDSPKTLKQRSQVIAFCINRANKKLKNSLKRQEKRKKKCVLLKTLRSIDYTLKGIKEQMAVQPKKQTVTYEQGTSTLQLNTATIGVQNSPLEYFVHNKLNQTSIPPENTTNSKMVNLETQNVDVASAQMPSNNAAIIDKVEVVKSKTKKRKSSAKLRGEVLDSESVAMDLAIDALISSLPRDKRQVKKDNLKKKKSAKSRKVELDEAAMDLEIKEMIEKANKEIDKQIINTEKKKKINFKTTIAERTPLKKLLPRKVEITTEKTVVVAKALRTTDSMKKQTTMSQFLKNVSKPLQKPVEADEAVLDNLEVIDIVTPDEQVLEDNEKKATQLESSQTKVQSPKQSQILNSDERLDADLKRNYFGESSDSEVIPETPEHHLATIEWKRMKEKRRLSHQESILQKKQLAQIDKEEETKHIEDLFAVPSQPKKRKVVKPNTAHDSDSTDTYIDNFAGGNFVTSTPMSQSQTREHHDIPGVVDVGARPVAHFFTYEGDPDQISPAEYPIYAAHRVFSEVYTNYLVNAGIDYMYQKEPIICKPPTLLLNCVVRQNDETMNLGPGDFPSIRFISQSYDQ